MFAFFILMENLLFVYIIEELKGEVWITGVAVFITVIFELPIFIKADYLLNTFDYF